MHRGCHPTGNSLLPPKGVSDLEGKGNHSKRAGLNVCGKPHCPPCPTVLKQRAIALGSGLSVLIPVPEGQAPPLPCCQLGPGKVEL